MWLSTEEQRSWRAFLEMVTLLTDTLDRELQAESGMPTSYYEILVRLSEAPDHRLRMSELARTSLSSRSRLSHAAARLELTGWVRREACDTDRRGAFAVLTDEGFRALQAAAPGHAASVRRHLLDRLTPDEFGELGRISELVGRPLADALPAGSLTCPTAC